MGGVILTNGIQDVGEEEWGHRIVPCVESRKQASFGFIGENKTPNIKLQITNKFQ
jgi:hypothetical protein